MVDYPPLLPTAGWFSLYLKELSKSQDHLQALTIANQSISSKEFGRYLLEDSKGNVHVHSIALEGGGRQLRNSEKMSDLRLSEHGEWRKVHLRSNDALLGKTPFYRSIEQQLGSVYSNTRLESLKEFNLAIFNILYSFLMGNVAPESLMQYKLKPVLKERGEEIAKLMHPSMSILQDIALYGKETLLGVLAMNEIDTGSNRG